MEGSSPGARSGRNDQFAWEDFDPRIYRDNNYASLRGDDKAMIQSAVEWFTGMAEARSPKDRSNEERRPFGHGVDVGSGANLYPALSMLGWRAGSP